MKYYLINEYGGSIGSGNECDLVIQDIGGKIQAKHVEITFEEGSFVITSVGDSEIFYNDSFSKLVAGYEVAISLGDTFKIGDIEFLCISPDKIDLMLESQQEHIQEIQDYKKLDNILIEPRGKVDGINLESSNTLDEATQSLDDTLDITPKQDSANDAKSTNDTTFGEANLKSFINRAINELLTPSIKKDSTHYNLKDKESVESLINNTSLLHSNKIINLLALSLMIKELDSPIFEEVSGMSFVEYLTQMLQNATEGDKEKVEQILLKALSKYLSKQ